jgi:hypothetical protein
MSCKECIHENVCKVRHFPSLFGITGDGCTYFKNKTRIELGAIDDFQNDIMSRFIDMCNGNDFNKINLLQIGDTIDHIFELHIQKRNGGDAE